MIELFDSNVRLGVPNKCVPGEPTSVEGLLAELRRLSIAQALVRHRLALETGPVAANHRILEELHSTQALLATWSLLPESTRETGDPAETVDRMIRLGVRAVWLYPKTHSYTLRDWCAGSLLTALEDRRVPVFLLFDEVVPDELAELLDRHRRLNVVLSNVNYRTNRWLYGLFARYPSLRMDLGAPHSLSGFVEQVVKRFGPERLLFGSGFPEHEIGPAVSYLLYAEISDDDKQLIARVNLHNLLGAVR
jgi:hypothetical protein